MRKYLLFVFVLLFVQVNPAFACSGGKPSTIAELVENAEVIVYGKLVQVDDAGQNAVMKFNPIGMAALGQDILCFHYTNRPPSPGIKSDGVAAAAFTVSLLCPLGKILPFFWYLNQMAVTV